MRNTISKNSRGVLIEKKSKFIANIFKVNSETEAIEQIKQMKKEYRDATHNVYAYIVLEEGQIVSRYSDDKEPKGTAGRPILFLLEQNNLCNVLVVVTRYFGGTLLGKGGLIRAYTKATKVAIEDTKIENM